MDDVVRLREALAEIEVAARGLRWAKERPWRVASHVFWEAQLPTIDAHDLSAKLLKRVLNCVVSQSVPDTQGPKCL